MYGAFIWKLHLATTALHLKIQSTDCDLKEKQSEWSFSAQFHLQITDNAA